MQRRDTNKQAQQPAAKQAMSTSKQLCSHTRAPVSRPVWKRDGTTFASNSGQFALRPRAVRSWWSYTAATVLTECGRCSIHMQQMLSQGDRATEHGQDGLSVARPHSCAWTTGRGKCAHLVGCESVVELLGGHSRGAACVFVARSARCVLPAVPKFLQKSFSWRCAGVRSLIMCMSLSSPLSCMRGGGPTPNFYDPHSYLQSRVLLQYFTMPSTGVRVAPSSSEHGVARCFEHGQWRQIDGPPRNLSALASHGSRYRCHDRPERG